jgi:dihydrofolate reductase
VDGSDVYRLASRPDRSATIPPVPPTTMAPPRRYSDEVMIREMGAGMSRPGDMLFGRRTWQDFITVWSRRTDDNPYTRHMNAATKYVVSTTLPDADAWQNSILLRGDAVETVAELKAGPGGDLGIIGSASLVRTLHAAGLIDHTRC